MKGNFQLIITGVFIFFTIAGVALFAIGGFGRDKEGDAGPATAVMWGTMDADIVNELISRLNFQNKEPILAVTYREIRPEEFDTTLVEALAVDEGPDIILMPEAGFVRHADKLFALPYESFSERAFKDTFLEASEILLATDGVRAFPFTVDPYVLYWNRTLFNNAGIARPPATWEEALPMVVRITERDEAHNISLSAIALGEFRNITHAQEILMALIMQAGSPIVSGTVDAPQAVLAERFGLPGVPAEAALRFYTEFANPSQALYSWNRALPASKDQFLAGKLGMYIGPASDLFALREANPNLNFDVAPLPQSATGGVKRTFSHITMLGVLKRSKNVNEAFRVVGILTTATSLKELESLTGLPPVRRDLLSAPQTDAFRGVFYGGALSAKSLLNPDSATMAALFKRMVEDVTSGRESISRAVSAAQRELDTLLR